MVVMERTNARFMEPGRVETPLDFASIDVAFISLDKILPALFPCLKEGERRSRWSSRSSRRGGKRSGNTGLFRIPRCTGK